MDFPFIHDYNYIYTHPLCIIYNYICNWLKWDVRQAHTNWDARRIALIVCCFFSCNQRMFKHVGLYLCFIDYSLIDSLIFNPLKYKVGITTLKCLLVVRFASEFRLPSPMVLLGKEGHGNIIYSEYWFPSQLAFNLVWYHQFWHLWSDGDMITHLLGLNMSTCYPSELRTLCYSLLTSWVSCLRHISQGWIIHLNDTYTYNIYI